MCTFLSGRARAAQLPTAPTELNVDACRIDGLRSRLHEGQRRFARCEPLKTEHAPVCRARRKASLASGVGHDTVQKARPGLMGLEQLRGGRDEGVELQDRRVV